MEGRTWPSAAATGMSVSHGVTELIGSRTTVDSPAGISVSSRTAEDGSPGADMAGVQSEASAYSSTCAHGPAYQASKNSAYAWKTPDLAGLSCQDGV